MGAILLPENVQRKNSSSKNDHILSHDENLELSNLDKTSPVKDPKSTMYKI